MSEHDLVLVVDFGAQYAQLIARRVREARVYSEIVPHTMPVAEMLARQPKAIVLSGGPSSVYEPRAPRRSTGRCSTAACPVFGMCYGFQLMAQALGGEVVADRAPASTAAPRSTRRRARHAAGRRTRPSTTSGCPTATRSPRRPQGFTLLASTAGTPVAAFEDVGRGLAGVQWHPEVLHTEHGQRVLEHFLLDDRRLPADLDDGQHRRGAGRARSAPRSATAGRSARSPAASTPRWPPRSCSARSATG